MAYLKAFLFCNKVFETESGYTVKDISNVVFTKGFPVKVPITIFMLWSRAEGTINGEIHFIPPRAEELVIDFNITAEGNPDYDVVFFRSVVISFHEHGPHIFRVIHNGEMIGEFPFVVHMRELLPGELAE